MGAMGHAVVTPERIMQLAWGYAGSLMIESAVRHRIFDLLDDSAKTVEDLATSTGASVRGLRALLNALAGLQLLTKDTEGRYGLTPESSQYLVSTRPSYLGGLARHTSTQLIPRWLTLNQAVEEGRPQEPVNREKVGAEFFHEFVGDIFPMSYPAAQVLGEVLDLASASKPVRVLDVAAGSGVWGIALAQKSEQVRVTAVDWPGVLDVTRKMADRYGVAGRFNFIAGDLGSVEFGSGYNIATLGHILHSEGEKRSRALLQKVFRAMAPGGKIAIQEFLVDDARTGPPMGLIFAVNMLVATEEGDTFSFNEIAGWLREAGFRNPQPVDSPGPSPLILADRP